MKLLQTIKSTGLLVAAGVLALSGLVAVPRQATAMGGDGEPTWIIQNCNDLRQLYLGVSAYTHDLTYELANDIDCNGVSMGTIGFGGTESFTGTFDGNGHTISNLTLGSSDVSSVGLFYGLEGATVKDVTLAHVSVTGTSDLGTLAVTSDGAAIENVHVTSGSVTGVRAAFPYYSIGGLVGNSSDTTYTDVTTNVTVTSDHSDVGGLIGYSEDDDILRAAAYGDVSGEQSVGGLIGTVYGSTAFWVHAKGNVVGDDMSVGGLIGSMEDATVASAYARGSVSGSDNVGGLIGVMYNNFSVSYSYSTGHVTVVPDGDAGGLIGQIESEGGDQGDTNFWDVESSGFATNHGNYPIGETTANMKVMDTFTNMGWDFTDEPIWGLVSTFNDGYPCHAWEEDCVTGGGQPADDDDDGVSSGTENAAPNNGDGNNDGTADSEQAHVVSLPGVDNTYITLVVDDSCTLADVAIAAEGSYSAQDAGYNYRSGLVNFTAAGCDDDETTVQIYYHGVSDTNLIVRKHNPNTNAYFTIDSATQTQASAPLSGLIVAYTITDNGVLDTNPASGVITDPVGLASLAVGVPNTGLNRKGN